MQFNLSPDKYNQSYSWFTAVQVKPNCSYSVYPNCKWGVHIAAITKLRRKTHSPCVRRQGVVMYTPEPMRAISEETTADDGGRGTIGTVPGKLSALGHMPGGLSALGTVPVRVPGLPKCNGNGVTNQRKELPSLPPKSTTQFLSPSY